MVGVSEVVDINLLAVLVSAVAMFVLGAIWYAPPIFGKAWQGLVKLSDKQLRENAGLLYFGAFLCYLIAAYALAYFNAQLGVSGAEEGCVVGALIGFGFVVPMTLSNLLFHHSRKKLWLINTGYQVLGLALMGAILGAWV